MTVAYTSRHSICSQLLTNLVMRMSSDNQNEKKKEKQIPSLNEYSAKPWSEWVNKTVNISTIFIDNATNSINYRNVRLLPRRDVNLYGLYPKMDQRVLNECDRCRAIVLPETFIIHSQTDCASEITLIKKKHTVKNKKKKDRFVTVRVPAPPLFQVTSMIRGKDCASEITLIKKKHTVKNKKKKDRFVTVRVPAPPLFQFPPSYDSKSATAESEQQQNEEEDKRKQLGSDIEHFTIFNDDSHKSNELGFNGSGGGHANTGSSETGSGSSTSSPPADQNITKDINTAETAKTTTTTTACGEASTNYNIPPPPPPSSPPLPPPPPPPPLFAAVSGSDGATTNNVISSSSISSSTASVAAVTVTVPVIVTTKTNNAPVIVAAVTVSTVPSAIDSVVNSASSTYRRQKKSGRTSRSATIAAMASNATTATTSGTSQLVDFILQMGPKTAASLDTATTATSTSSLSLRTKSSNIIASVKLALPTVSPKITRRSTGTTTCHALSPIPTPIPVPIPAVPVRIPVPIPAVVPPRYSGIRTGYMARSVLGTGLYPRTLASVRVRSISNRCTLSTLRRPNESFNTTLPTPSQHTASTPQSASQCFLPSYTPTPSCIVPAQPVALISPLQVSMYKTQQDQHFIFTNTRSNNSTYHGHPKPLTLATASTQRLGDSFLLQGQRVDSQLHDIQTYLSKRFALCNKSQSSDLHIHQDQSSPSQQHHSNPRNHHRTNILKNSNSAGGSPRALLSTKRPSFVSSAKEDASSSSTSPSSLPAAKLRRTSSSTSVAEVNGIILHADVSSESAAEAPNFSLPTSLDSGDSGIPLSPTETINAIQTIAVPLDTCDFSELHIFEVSQ